MSCTFSEQEIFNYLDTKEVTQKINQCKVYFHEQGQFLLTSNQYKTDLIHCPLFNPYQVYRLSKLSSTEIKDSRRVGALINKHGVLGMVTPINSKCHNTIINTFTTHT